MNRRTSWTATALALAVSISGCAIAPQPAPTSTVEVPAAWHTQIGPAAAVEAQWWKSFNDPSLDALVSQALERNTDLRTARSRIAEYQARLTVAQAGQSPSLSGGFAPSRARSRTATGAFATTTSYQLNVQASYEVDLWGRLGNLSDAAVADLQTQQAAADAAALSVAATAASGYLNLLGLDAQLKVAQATLKTREDSLARTRKQFDIGYSSRLEWVQAQSEYHAAAIAVPQLQRSVSQQENALDILIGENPGGITRGATLDALVAPPTASVLPSELLRRRPDIDQAELRIVSADSSLAAARAQLLPSLQLSTSAALQGFTLRQLIDAPSLLWSVGGSVLAPVLQGGRLRAQTEIVAAQRDQAVFAYEQVVRNAFGEVENALVAIDSLREQNTEAQARVDSAAEALRIARNRYRNGYASYLEELDAQRTSYTAQQSSIQIRQSLLAAHVDLYRALGGGWTAPSTALSSR
ncbi:efflux transporter outer membrane subunit [soil metagenome]